MKILDFLTRTTHGAHESFKPTVIATKRRHDGFSLNKKGFVVLEEV
jgi:hypothetical protein